METTFARLWINNRGSAPINENRPDSSFFSADSKRKHGPPRRASLAKAETGVSTSATNVATTGITLPPFASDRNSSIEGVTRVSCMSVYCSGGLRPSHFVSALLSPVEEAVSFPSAGWLASRSSSGGPPSHKASTDAPAPNAFGAGAGDETRTRDVLLGKEVLYH